MTQQGRKLIQYQKAMSYLQADFQPVCFVRLYPQRSSIQGSISGKPQRNYSTVSWQMYYVIISHTRKHNNHTVKHLFEVNAFSTHVHRHTETYIYIYVLLHTHVYMDVDIQWHRINAQNDIPIY